MPFTKDVFRTFDIRGKYPVQIDEELVGRIGFCLGEMFPDVRKVVVGADFRRFSQKLVEPLIAGLVAHGKKVYFLGQVPTEMLYFALGFFRFDLGVQITASHCSWEETGLKIAKKKVVPLSTKEIGLLKERVAKSSFEYSGERPDFETIDIYTDYAKFVVDHLKKEPKGRVLLFSLGESTVKIAELVAKHLPLTLKVVPLSQQALKNLPPNPLLPEIHSLVKRRSRGNYDLIVALDGDSDRMIVFEPKSREMVLPDFVAGLLAESVLTQKRGPIVFDCRKRMALELVTEQFGVSLYRTKAGYPFIKREMRRRKAVFGGEVSGHYFYPENFYSESSMLSILRLLGLLEGQRKTLAEKLKMFRTHIYSLPEENFSLPASGFSPLAAALQEEFKGAKSSFIDGITLEGEGWYLNIRLSQTEPLVRLNLEAESKSLLKEIYQRAKRIILKAK